MSEQAQINITCIIIFFLIDSNQLVPGLFSSDQNRPGRGPGQKNHRPSEENLQEHALPVPQGRAGRLNHWRQASQHQKQSKPI